MQRRRSFLGQDPRWLTLELKEVVMVWKQDLARMKGGFPEGEGTTPQPVQPKPKPIEVKDLSGEDAFFLAAMGAPLPRPQAPVTALLVAPAPLVTEPSQPDVSFQDELSGLRGMKPLSTNPVLNPTLPPPAPTPAMVESSPTVLELLPPLSAALAVSRELPVKGESPSTDGPIRIQLAAGMAVEVDATLDLRQHSLGDAMGRLLDRVEDGALLGWRTLHVLLGEDEALHAAMLELLAAGGIPKINRYAQAPIPMGGAQAWVLYY